MKKRYIIKDRRGTVCNPNGEKAEFGLHAPNLGEGDMSIHTMDNCASEMVFPLKHYRGISVVINLELTSSVSLYGGCNKRETAGNVNFPAGGDCEGNL